MTDSVDFAEYYDLDHDVTEDIPFYLDVARECGSPILELACGTGRVLVPLAQPGFDVHGIEIEHLFRDYERRLYDGTGEMLAVARRSSGA